MSSPSYEDVRQQIERRYSRWMWFVVHVIMAVITTIIIWLIDPTPQDGTGVLAGLWFGVLICHAVWIYMQGLRDHAVERAWERVSDQDDKPKRTGHSLRLADDAELDVIDDEPATRLRSISSNER